MNKKELLMSYIRANVSPILVDFITSANIKGAITIPADINIEELNGHYDGEYFLPPKWFSLVESTKTPIALVIEGIDSISKEEQLKFCELLEHRKISTFELPNNVVIIITAKEINKEKINEEIYSLVAHII